MATSKGKRVKIPLGGKSTLHGFSSRSRVAAVMVMF